jgi:hypothetical protein
VNYLQGLGHALHATGADRESVVAFSEQLELSLRLLKTAPNDLGTRESVLMGHRLLGDAYLAIGDIAAADRHLRTSSEMVAVIRKEYPKDLYFLRDAADLERSLGDLAAERGDAVLTARHYENGLAFWAEWGKLAADSRYATSQAGRVREAYARAKAGSVP